VAVLSYATWQSRFNRNPRILGAKILLGRKPYVLIGVMPRNFEFPLVPGHLNLHSRLLFNQIFEVEHMRSTPVFCSCVCGGQIELRSGQVLGRRRPLGLIVCLET
jgi:hypothetical protein